MHLPCHGKLKSFAGHLLGPGFHGRVACGVPSVPVPGDLVAALLETQPVLVPSTECFAGAAKPKLAIALVPRQFVRCIASPQHEVRVQRTRAVLGLHAQASTRSVQKIAISSYHPQRARVVTSDIAPSQLHLSAHHRSGSRVG